MAVDKVPKTIRKKTSVYVDGFEWDRFIKNVHTIKSSSCHFIEPFIMAVSDSIEKLDSRPILPTSNITINMDLNVQRVVRRRKKLGEPEEKTVWRGDVDTCCECGSHPFYIGGHRTDPFTYVKRYLCVDCFKFCSRNHELTYWNRIKNNDYYYEPKEARVVAKVSRSKNAGFMVSVKDFKDWIGIKID